MKPGIALADVPAASALRGELHDAYFHDCYELDIDPGDRTALAMYLAVMANTPAWVDALMATRNRIVGRLGLKDLGRMRAIDGHKTPDSYRIGDRAGIFTILAMSDEEVVLGDADKHLTVKVSVCKVAKAGRPRLAVSTVVHVHNALGRLYMFFVEPAHKVIAPAVLARAVA
jgi:hypothetical protein